MYQLKVTKQPKIVKATKAFKTNKYYSLYDAEKQYQAIFQANPSIDNEDDLTLEITISTDQKGKDGQNEYEMDIPVSNFDSLSELVSLEMQRYLSGAPENEAVVIQRDADTIAKEFLTETLPTRSSQHEGQSLMTRLKNRRAQAKQDEKKATQPNENENTQKAVDSSEEEQLLKQKEEQVHQFLSGTNTTEDSSDEIKIEEASLPVQPSHSSTNTSDSIKQEVKLRRYKGGGESITPREDTAKSNIASVASPQPTKVLIDESQYVDSFKDDPTIIQAKEAVMKPLKEAISEGNQYVIQKMAIQPTDSQRMLELKHQYIEKNYNSDRLNQIQSQLDLLLQDNAVESRNSLQERYRIVLGDGGKEVIQQALNAKQNELEEEEKHALEKAVNHLGENQKVEKERMEKRHTEETNALQSRHQQESIDLTERQTQEMNQLIQQRKQDFNQRKQVILDELKVKTHDDWVAKTNETLQIERDTIKKQMLSKIQAIGIQENTALKEYIQSWQHNIQSNQESFDQQEQRLIDEDERARQLKVQEEEKAKQERLRQEEKAERDRQLKLEEDKLRLQQKQIEVEQQKNDKALVEKETTIKELQTQMQELKEDLKTAQEKLHEERIERIQDQSRFNETIELQQRNFEFEQQKQQLASVETPRKPLSEKQKKHLMIASTVAVLGIGVAGVGWKAHQDAVAEQAKQEEIQKAQQRKQDDLEASLKETQESLKSVKDENQKLSQKNKELEQKKKTSSKEKK